MLYVAGEIFLWMALAFLLGLLVGWLIWGWLSRRRREQEREAEERAAADREARAAAASLGTGSVGVDEPVVAAAREAVSSERAMGMRGPRAETTASLVAESPDVVAAGFVTDAPDAAPDAPVTESDAPVTESVAARAAEPRPAVDVVAGEAILGYRVVIDDLKLVEGIGPRIEEVLHEAGIRTWVQLSEASPPQLRSALDDAGQQFRIHDPGTWPQQAELALGNRWAELKELQDHLRAGRA
jgi:predicted flap endonuclease-1-like 5' DNA nuclease